MPLLKIQTNTIVPKEERDPILSAMTDLLMNELHKPKEYIQVVLEPNQTMHFAGSDDPTALVELRALGLSDDKTKPMSVAICRFLKDKLQINPDRVFINFQDIPRARWGWNSSTFA